MSTIGIYKIEQVSRGRVVYVGSSNNTAKRIVGHRYYLNKGTHRNPFLQRAWNKYGKFDFEFSVIEVASLDVLIEREQYWIDRLQPYCNIVKTAGRPHWGHVVTAETRRKIGLAHRGKKLSQEQIDALRLDNVGHSPSAETREKLRIANSGQRRTDEQRQRMSEAQRGNQHALGYKHSPESIEKMKLAQVGRVVSDEARLKMRLAKLGKKRGPMSEEHKRKIGDSNRRRMQKENGHGRE